MFNDTDSVATPLVKNLLEKIEIARKQHPAGDVCLGTEVAFGKEFGISRMTVRRALDDLIAQGLIVRRRGKGIYMPAPSSIQRVIQFVVPNLLHEECIQYLKGIQIATQDRNVAIQVYDANSDFEHAIELIDHLPRLPAAGAIIALIRHPEFIRKLIELQHRNHPFVVLGNLSDIIDAPMVTGDMYNGGYQMAQDLIAKGHKKIGHIARFASRTNIELNRGLNAALNDTNIALPGMYQVDITKKDDLLADWTDSIHSATQQLMELDEPPTAILYNDDRAALIAYQWFRKAGYRLPEDISIIGVGDTEMGHYAYPALSSIHQPQQEAGSLAVSMLEQLAENPSIKQPLTTLEPHWVCRESVIPYTGK